jgi:gluconolactonase
MKKAPVIISAWAIVIAITVNVSAATKKTVPPKKTVPVYPAVGQLESLDPQFSKLISPQAKVEKLAEGFEWAEGPVWWPRGGCILFSDVPKNVVHSWKSFEGIKDFLKPSGYTGSTTRGGEPGSNGLALDNNGRLVLCEHGDRRISRLEANGTKTTLAEYYLFNRFNSPNDLAYRSDGNLYFTDPPYGLEKLDQDPKKELILNGIFQLSPAGKVTLLTPELRYPNGIAFSPDEKTLYVANSFSEQPVIMAYPVNKDGGIGAGRVFFDATALAKKEKGLPDGLKVDYQGNLFATGPGGVLVISPQGKHLGSIKTGDLVSNCNWGENGSVLYLTSNHMLCRIQTLTKGKGF